MTTRSAVFRTLVSMDCDVVEVVSFSMRGCRVSIGKRGTNGFKLQNQM